MATTLEQAQQRVYQDMQAIADFRVGDVVKIVRKATTRQWGWGGSWQGVMDAYADSGRTHTVGRIHPERGIQLRNHHALWFPFFVLELVERPRPPVNVRLNSTHVAQVKQDRVMVGCQEFAFDRVLALAEAVIKQQEENEPPAQAKPKQKPSIMNATSSVLPETDDDDDEEEEW